MHVNSKFAVAIHFLAIASVADEFRPGAPLTSDEMARYVSTNPAFVRRVLGGLRDAGLVRSQPGPGGGWRLNRPAAEITLGDVYRAVSEESIFAIPERDQAADCQTGPDIPPVLLACFADAEAAMLGRLDQTTISEVAESARANGVDPVRIFSLLRQGLPAWS